jgi:hypothetical protein
VLLRSARSLLQEVIVVCLFPVRICTSMDLHALDLLPRLLLLARLYPIPLISILDFLPGHLLLISISTARPSYFRGEMIRRSLTCSSLVKLIINSGFPNGNVSPLSTCQKWYVLPYKPTTSFISSVSAISQTAPGTLGFGIMSMPLRTCTSSITVLLRAKL